TARNSILKQSQELIAFTSLQPLL
ncbi:hypothetical protein Goshw_024454, partial [Gossypium schwendimanii]|nr:hypothetical protein [Gossypium schwendimanii]